MIHAQLIKGQAVVLLVLGHEVFELFLEGGFLLFQVLDDVAVVAFLGGVLDDKRFVFVDLLL